MHGIRSEALRNGSRPPMGCGRESRPFRIALAVLRFVSDTASSGTCKAIGSLTFRSRVGYATS